jgi:hypothetical protein
VKKLTNNLVVIFIVSLIAINISAQIVVVRPKEIDDVLTNPDIGFTTFQCFNGDFAGSAKSGIQRYFARDFYGTGGLACPGVMSYSGQPLGGWGQYAMSPSNSAWSAHLFYLHWLYTADEVYLKEKAYPWCSGVGECMLGLLKPDENGILKLPLSSSPEIFDDSPESWLQPNSNYDLMCLKMLFLSLSEMATASNLDADTKNWSKAALALGGFHKKTDGESGI